MASAFGHGFTGFMLGKILFEKPLPARFWVLSVICGILPDADAIGYYLGVPYGSMFGHRGFTHSILFAALIGLIVAWLAFAELGLYSRDWWTLAGYFFLVTISHALLDAMTTGGYGVAFFAPFENRRYFFPLHPIKVSPMSVAAFFNERGLSVLSSEATWIGAPLLVVWLCKVLLRRWF